MYLGHYAIAFAAKKASPGTSLGTLIAASQLMDIIWPVLILTGIEKVSVAPEITLVTPLHFIKYPFTHSLLMVLVWAAIFSSFYLMTTKNRAGSLVVWFAVMSHWVLDYFTHIPDLPLYPGSEYVVGLGLWNSLEGTMLLELGLFLVGLALYLRVTRTANRIGSYSLFALVLFLVVTYLANILGPPPPDYQTVAWSAMLLWLIVPWGYWIDRNRHLRHGPGSRTGKLKFRGKLL